MFKIKQTQVHICIFQRCFFYSLIFPIILLFHRWFFRLIHLQVYNIVTLLQRYLIQINQRYEYMKKITHSGCYSLEKRPQTVVKIVTQVFIPVVFLRVMISECMNSILGICCLGFKTPAKNEKKIHPSIISVITKQCKIKILFLNNITPKLE